MSQSGMAMCDNKMMFMVKIPVTKLCKSLDICRGGTLTIDQTSAKHLMTNFHIGPGSADIAPNDTLRGKPQRRIVKIAKIDDVVIHPRNMRRVRT